MRENYCNSKTLEENKKSVDEVIGKRIKSLRTSEKCTQKDFADFLEMGKSEPQKISYIERGRRTIPANLLPVIADRYDTYVETFFIEDATNIYGFNLIANLIDKLSVSGKDKANLMYYMEHLTERAIEHNSVEKMFDIIYSILKIGSWGELTPDNIKAEIHTINSSREHTDKSVYLDTALMMSRELDSNRQ